MACYIDDDFRGLLHAFEGDVLEGAVEGIAAGAEVGTGEAFVGELGTIGAPANRVGDGSHAAEGDGVLGQGDDFRMLLHDRVHILVGVGDFQGEGPGRVLVTKLLYAALEEGFLVGKLACIVVPDQERAL